MILKSILYVETLLRIWISTKGVVTDIALAFDINAGASYVCPAKTYGQGKALCFVCLRNFSAPFQKPSPWQTDKNKI